MCSVHPRIDSLAASPLCFTLSVPLRASSEYAAAKPDDVEAAARNGQRNLECNFQLWMSKEVSRELDRFFSNSRVWWEEMDNKKDGKMDNKRWKTRPNIIIAQVFSNGNISTADDIAAILTTAKPTAEDLQHGPCPILT